MEKTKMACPVQLLGQEKQFFRRHPLRTTTTAQPSVTRPSDQQQQDPRADQATARRPKNNNDRAALLDPITTSPSRHRNPQEATHPSRLPTRTTAIEVHPRQQHQQVGGRQEHLPSCLDYCFEYEAVSRRERQQGQQHCLPVFSLVTAVRIQGDVPSRRKTSNMDVAETY